MRTFLAVVCVLQPLFLQQALAQGSDSAAYTQIVNEKNPETKKKLALNFEKNFPKSRRLPEAYIELSRALASESDFGTAKMYAQKALDTVTKMKTLPAPEEYTDTTWHQWLGTVENSAKTNLTWVNQMVTWQQQTLRSTRAPH